MEMKNVTLFFAILLSLSIMGCRTAFNPELASKLGKKELKVGVETEFPPVIFKDKENGKVVGLEADLAEELGKILGVKIVFVQTEWTKLIPELKAGRIDVIMSGMTVTKERAEEVKFIEPYIRVGQLALVRTVDVSKFSNAEVIKKSRVLFGAINGTTGELFIKANCPNAVYSPYDAVPSALRDLEMRKIDVFICDSPTIWSISNVKLTPICEPLTEEYLAWAVNKENQNLADVLNQALKSMKDDGILRKLEHKWIPEFIMESIYEKK